MRTYSQSANVLKNGHIDEIEHWSCDAWTYVPFAIKSGKVSIENHEDQLLCAHQSKAYSQWAVARWTEAAKARAERIAFIFASMLEVHSGYLLPVTMQAASLYLRLLYLEVHDRVSLTCKNAASVPIHNHHANRAGTVTETLKSERHTATYHWTQLTLFSGPPSTVSVVLYIN